MNHPCLEGNYVPFTVLVRGLYLIKKAYEYGKVEPVRSKFITQMYRSLNSVIKQVQYLHNNKNISTLWLSCNNIFPQWMSDIILHACAH